MKIELNELLEILTSILEEEIGESIDLNSDSKLFGGSGPLDSMSLVNLLVELEEYIEDKLDITITLADEKAMSRRTSPFSRVDNLLNYINERIEANG